MEKRKMRYKGAYPIFLQAPGYHGTDPVKPGDEVEMDRKEAEELRSHDDWVMVTEKKSKGGES